VSFEVERLQNRALRAGRWLETIRNETRGAIACMKTEGAFAQAPGRGVIASLVGAIICFTTTAASAEGRLKFAGSQLEPIKWSELAGWTADDHLAAFAAYQTSCQGLRKRRTDDRGQISGALSNVCRKAAELQPQDANTARAFFEQNFQPVRIGRLGEAEGLLTGYFEPIVAGSRFPSPEFPVPLYRRPRDLVAAGYKPSSLAFPNKGVQIGRRTENNELVPYHDRGAIEAGALDGQKLEICWLRNRFDLLAIQIEGSGRVILEDGTPLRVSFDSHNGYRFSSIERVLIDRNLISREEISTQRIRDWMAAHPHEAAKVRAADRSYVFFRVTGLSNDGEPVGAQGVPLTPGRSIAVDRVHEYGTPFFIEASLPIESGKPVSPFRRLMIAQDTGSSIVGPTRADLYWGAGDDAGRIAGRIRHPGRFVMLLPRELDIVAAGSEMPLPAPKPKIAALQVAKQNGKGKVELVGTGAVAAGKMPSPAAKTKIAALEVGKQDGKGKANSANAGASATGRKTPSPLPKTKIAAIEVGKQDGKGKANSANAGAGAIATGRKMPSPLPKTTIAAIEVGKQDGKGKANSADAGAIATGRQKPSPAAKTKIAALEVGKQDGKGKANSANVGATATGREMPSPLPKTKIAAIEVGKRDGKDKANSANAGAIATGRLKPSPAPKTKIAAIEARKQDAKGKADSASVGAIAAGGKQKPSLAPKSKTPGIEVKKQNGKGKAEAANAQNN
jgi:membrane-bound lytic murein transglycosylase A